MTKQNWSRKELEASVRSYLEMPQKDLDGKKYKKMKVTFLFLGPLLCQEVNAIRDIIVNSQ